MGLTALESLKKKHIRIGKMVSPLFLCSILACNENMY